MKSTPLLLPPVGSIDAFTFEGRDPELFTVDEINFDRGHVCLSAVERNLCVDAPIGDVLRRRRPRSVQAWAPQIAKDYTLTPTDLVGLAEENADAARRAWVQRVDDQAAMESMSNTLSPATPTFSKGERVRVARKVESAGGVRTHWAPAMDALVGRDGTFLNYTPDGEALVSIDGSGPNKEPWAWSFPPESLEPAPQPIVPFAQGDRARVLRRFETSDHPDLSWEPEMDETIGKVGEVTDYDSSGVRLDFGDGVCWWYTRDVLERVTE